VKLKALGDHKHPPKLFATMDNELPLQSELICTPVHQ